MPNLTITAANVKADTSAKTEGGTAGVAITAGQVLYQAAATGKLGLSDTDSATAEVRSVKGIALNGAAADQPVRYVTSGKVTIGATLSVGVGYYLSATAGAICPVADLATGAYPVFLGFAISTTVLDLDIKEAGVALP